jgi:hypothetical protein
MVVTPDRPQADRVRHLATQARQPTLHYEHRGRVQLPPEQPAGGDRDGAAAASQP